MILAQKNAMEKCLDGDWCRLWLIYIVEVFISIMSKIYIHTIHVCMELAMLLGQLI